MQKIFDQYAEQDSSRQAESGLLDTKAEAAPETIEAYMVQLAGGEGIALHFQRVHADAKAKEWDGSAEVVPLVRAQQAAAPGALPERDPTKPAEHQGLFRKFEVRRTDGSDRPGGKHDGCRYYVLDLTHDQHAPAAMRAYAAACAVTHPLLAADIVAEFGAAPSAPGTPEAPADDRKGIALWQATLRACGELPEGYEVRIELENGCGMAVWHNAEGERHVIDGDGYLSDDVNEAVDAAIERAAQLDGGQGEGK